eukprot:COSAG04_NODE_49_length_31209_cov_11.630248_15_plen_267_part_00
MYPIQDVADMLGLTLDQMAMMGSLVENDFMKHATHLKEFHYRIGVLRHPMDTVVCVGKYLKEGGSQHPDDIFMAETDQTVRSAYSERLRQSVLQYNRPQIDTCFRLRGEEASAAIKALPSEESPDYPDFDLLRLLDRSGLHDAFRDGLLEPSVVQVLWNLHEMNAGRMPKKPVTYRTPSSLNDWISRGKHPGVMLWPLRRRLVEAVLQVRRSMHQDCLLKPRNFVFYPFFTHFPPSFAHFLRLDARNPENTTRSPGENGKKSIKIG